MSVVKYHGTNNKREQTEIVSISVPQINVSITIGHLVFGASICFSMNSTRRITTIFAHHLISPEIWNEKEELRV